MLALKTNCKHPETQAEYVKSSVGGLNNSPENVAVRDLQFTVRTGEIER